MTERIPSSPPEIKPVANNIPRPLWSVMIPTYNCSQFLIDNLQSVLEQAPGPELMQIEVIDDCSTDTDVEYLVQKIGRGRVNFYRQPVNVGSLRNFETCLNRAKGHYIHLLHGDDMVMNGFYSEIEQVFTSFPEIGAAFTGYYYVDEQNQQKSVSKDLLLEPGVLKNWLIEIARTQMIQPPSMVVKRSVYEQLGGFFAVHYGEDWEMWVRIAAHFPVAHSPKKLACYRLHHNNITNRSFLTGQSITDTIKVIEIMQQYLPQKERANIKREATKNLAHYFAYTAQIVYHVYAQPLVALEQSKRAMAMHFSYKTFVAWLKIKIKVLIGYKTESKTNWLYRPINFFK